MAIVAALTVTTCGVVAANDGRWKRHVVHEGGRCNTSVAADFTGDGLPDVWEAKNGSDPAVHDSLKVDATGYTKLERYFHARAAQLIADATRKK